MLAVSKAAAAKLSAAQTAAAAAIAGRERHGDGGAEVLAGGAGLERHEARRHIKTAAVIEASPAVRDAVESGRVSKANARRLADAIEQTGAQVVESDAELLANAESMSPDQFASRVRRWTADHQDDGGEAQYRRLQARRSVRVFDGDDGMMHLRGEFDPVTGTRIANRLRAQARRFLNADKQANKRAAKQPADGHSGRRSFDQCMADALDNLTAAGSNAAAAPTTNSRSAGRSAGRGTGSSGSRSTSSNSRNTSSSDGTGRLIGSSSASDSSNGGNGSGDGSNANSSGSSDGGNASPGGTGNTGTSSAYDSSDSGNGSGDDDGSGDSGTGRDNGIGGSGDSDGDSDSGTGGNDSTGRDGGDSSTGDSSTGRDGGDIGGGGGGCGGGRPFADICVVARVDDATGELIAELPDGTRLPDAVLDELACNAKITGAIFDRTGKAIWRTQSRRTVTEAQWQLLIAKWGGCFHCGANPGICQGHHIDPASRGGPTKLDNLVPACWECHHRIHHHGWWIRKSPDGNHTLHPPDGVNYGPARAPEQAPLFKPAAEQAPDPLPPPHPATDHGPPAVSGPAAARAALQRARAAANTTKPTSNQRSPAA